jgi:6-phosphogluconolactonase
LVIDATQKYLLSASYRAGTVEVLKLGPGHKPEQSIAYLVSGEEELHSVNLSRDNRFLYLAFVKQSNTILQYRFNADSGTIAPLDPPGVKQEANTGPRHAAFHPTLPFVYFSHEQQLGVGAYRIDADSGALAHLATYEGGSQPAAHVHAADIAITPDGNYVYLSVRDFGGDNDYLYGYRVMADGTLEKLQSIQCDDIPWAIRVSPNGSWLYMVATFGRTLNLYRIEGNGCLTFQEKLDTGVSSRHVEVVASGRLLLEQQQARDAESQTRVRTSSTGVEGKKQ